MRDKFEYLNERLKERGITNEYLSSHVIKKGHTYVSERMRGLRPWTLDDMYAIMEFIGEPLERLHIAFPKAGVVRGKVPKPYVDLTKFLECLPTNMADAVVQSVNQAMGGIA